MWHSLHGGNCPICKSSNGEQLVRQYLIDEQIEYKREYAVNIGKTYYRYDFYLPILKILIEFDGLQHFKPVELMGGVTELKRIQHRDKLKDNWAKENNIPLIRISYKDIKHIREYLNKRISLLYSYRYNKIFYKTFKCLCQGEGLPLDTKLIDMEQYLYYKKCSV